jgi:hypothetical protein
MSDAAFYNSIYKLLSKICIDGLRRLRVIIELSVKRDRLGALMTGRSLNERRGAARWLRRWRQGRSYGLGLALCITCMAILVRLLIRMLSLPRLMALLDTQAPRPPRSPMAPAALVELTQTLLRLSWPRRHRQCMTRSLTAFYFLRRWGHPVRLYVGVARREGELTGHCWLELCDVPLAEPMDPRLAFTTVAVFPPPLAMTEASS